MPLGLRQLFLGLAGREQRRIGAGPASTLHNPPITPQTLDRSVVPELGKHFEPGLASPSGGPKFGGRMDSGVDRSPHSHPGNVTKALGTAQNQPRCPAAEREDRRGCRPLDQVLSGQREMPPPPPPTQPPAPCPVALEHVAPGAHQHRQAPVDTGTQRACPQPWVRLPRVAPCVPAGSWPVPGGFLAFALCLDSGSAEPDLFAMCAER